MNKFKLSVTFLACGVERTDVIETQNTRWPWVKELKITCEE